MNTRPEYRNALCRLRISAHDLQTERGSYTNTARADRKCRTCGVVKYQLNFLDDCVHYDLLRQRPLNNPSVWDLCTDGTMNNNYRPSDLHRLDKAQMYLAEYVHHCMSVYITVCLYTSLYVCIHHCMSVYITVMYVYTHHCMSVYITVCLYTSLYVCIHHCMSVPP